jgi:hypothetical protein
MDARLEKLLLGLLLLGLLVAIQPEKVFAGWLFAAPLLQGLASGTHAGHRAYTAFFLVPPLVLVVRMATGRVQRNTLWIVDALPALYLGYVLVSLHLLNSNYTAPANLRAVYSVAGIGIVAYYFVAFGKTSERFPRMVAGSLVWSGIVVAVLALVEEATGWNIWNNVLGGTGQVRRVLSSFSSPAALGAYLGVGVSFAIAILVWKGPRSLRLPAIALIVLSIPASYFTYTRGPIVAMAAVGVLIPVIANRARWPSLLLFATVAIVLFATWGNISSSPIYTDRLAVTSTVTDRVALQDVSLELFRQRPAFGWGYNTFDQVKLSVPTRYPQIVDTTTSHDTFLTVLVELGAVGLVFLVLPWAVIARRAVAAARHGWAEPWIVGGCLGGAAVYVIGALTYDSRFFSIVTALPWIALGLARRASARQELSADASP